MTQDNRNHFDQALDAVRHDEPSASELHDAAGRIWQNMQAGAQLPAEAPIRGCEDVVHLLPAYAAGSLGSDRRLLVEAHVRECLACRHRAARHADVNWAAPLPLRGRGFRLAWAVAMVAAVAAGLAIYSIYFAVPAGARARVQSVQGDVVRITAAGEYPLTVGAELYEGDLLRTSSGGHAFVQLRDGSNVEVNERSEFDLKARGNNLTVNLDQGAVIVTAAKRRTGHLYVKTPDARVAVTGTVFSVTSGMKGSRVSVLAGVVAVTHAGVESSLRAGQQVTTSDNMTQVPVRDDIAWSQELGKHLELLASLSTLEQRLSQVQMPGPRYSSTLLDRVPANTVLYISIPNLGNVLGEAHSILKQQMNESETLRQWFGHGVSPDPQLDQLVERIREMSQYVGDEVVIVGTDGQDGIGSVAAVAELRASGLRDYLTTNFGADNKNHQIVTVDAHDLATLTQASTHGRMVALVRDDVVVFSDNVDGLDRMNSQLNAGASGFSATEFGQRIQEAYNRGAGFVLAGNLQQMISDLQRTRAARGLRADPELAKSGFGDATYFIAEHREINNNPDNHLVLDFAAARHGIASWLAAPAPMGSLEFVSSNAGLAMSIVTKEPRAMLDDILNMLSHRRALHPASDQQNVIESIVQDEIVPQLGGDGAFALDGPVLPTPSWKVVLEVHDPVRLQAAVEKLVAAGDQQEQQHGKRGVGITYEDVGGQRYYTITDLDTGVGEAQYTYAAGYLIMAPTRAVLMAALRTRITGDSLAHSAAFRAMLPKDQHANYSGVAYQNLAPILQPLMTQLNEQQAVLVQQIAADSRPSLICAWGDSNRIEAASNSRLFGYDWLALMSLVGPQHPQRSAP